VSAAKTTGAEAPATRRRGAELEDAILDAGWSVLSEQGYAGFTYEAVAARAGTSRPVLYRRWPQREDLLLATLRRQWWSRPVTVPDTGSLREDAIQLLRNSNVARVHMITLLNVQLLDYFRETGTTISELREFIRGRDAPTGFDTIVARAVARGELSDTRRPKRVVNLPFDLFRHELLITQRAIPDDVIEEIVDDIWLPLVTA